jgi:hypothetical protein
MESYQREEITLVRATEYTKKPLATDVPMGVTRPGSHWE